MRNEMLTFSTVSNQRLSLTEKRVDSASEPENINVWCMVMQQQQVFALARTTT